MIKKPKVNPYALDRASQEELDRILLIPDLGSLTESDKSFLRARQSYLTLSEKRDYASILNENVATPISGNIDSPEANVVADTTNRDFRASPEGNNHRLPDNAPQETRTDSASSDEVDNLQALANETQCLDPDCVNPEHNHE